MKALSYSRFGGPEVLRIAEMPTPDPSPGHVLVAVRAASLNLIDARVRNGQMGPLVNKRFPKVAGADFAGVVRAVGAGVTGLTVGEAVYGALDPFKGGAFAEIANVPAGQLAPLPIGIGFEEAASLPIAGLAALTSVRDLGRVTAGQRVLIHGASGPVGLFAVQIAKHLGAHVTAVAGQAGLAAAEAFGADVLIDYRKQDATIFTEPFDMILNASGKLPFALGRHALRPDGRLIEPAPSIPVFIGSKVANLFRRQQHLVLQTVPARAPLETLSTLVASGVLKTTIATTLPMDSARQGFLQMERGGTVGKIVVTVQGGVATVDPQHDARVKSSRSCKDPRA